MAAMGSPAFLSCAFPTLTPWIFNRRHPSSSASSHHAKYSLTLSKLGDDHCTGKLVREPPLKGGEIV